MSEKKPFLLRVDPTVMEALRRWADDDLRSLNGQIEFLLRRALRDAGRLAGSGERYGAGPPPRGRAKGTGARTDTDTGAGASTDTDTGASASTDTDTVAGTDDDG